MKVAVSKYPVEEPSDFTAFANKQRQLLEQARRAGAELAVLPEYLALELAAGLPAAVRSDVIASLAALQPLQDAWLALFGELSRELGLIIQAGTFLTDVGQSRYRNRAWWFAPDGSRGFQDKLQLTGYEKKLGVIEGGDALRVFDTGPVRSAIAVCYDVQFPLPVRSQWEAGARLLLVPSCTDTDAGATRVRVGCMARALENRMFVAKAVTAGIAAWSPALDVNTGEATIYAPMDHGLPANGLLAITHGDQPWAIAELDFAALQDSQRKAQVANDQDWPNQRTAAVDR
ncbi:MAG: carbon-nitrogen hydrolase family protein [Lysobacter sp.]